MKKETDVLTVHEIGKDGSETVKKNKINDDGTLGRKLSSVKRAIRYARENAMTILPHGQCVPYAVFNGGCNDNIAAIAGSGRGKTRTLVEPNILAAASSMIISDPKGYLYKKYKDILEKNGFKVKHLNARDPRRSGKYNPMKYSHSYNDIQKLANMTVYLMSNKYGSYDPMWDKLAAMLISAAMAYLYEGGTYAPNTLSGVIKLISAIDTNAMEEGRSCTFDRIFNLHNEQYKRSHDGKESWAYEQYVKFKGLSNKTLGSVVITVHGDLGALDTPEIREMTETDEMDITSIGQEKTAVFVEISDTDRSKDMLVNMFYSQAMSELCDFADSQENNRLPVPVRFILDDFGTTSKIENFEKMISNIRSRGISAMLMLQSVAQLRNNYGEEFETILNNCDTTIYLGGNNAETAKYISELVNKTPNSILTMPMNKCWIFRGGGSVTMADTVDIDSYQKPQQRSGIDKEAV